MNMLFNFVTNQAMYLTVRGAELDGAGDSGAQGVAGVRLGRLVGARGAGRRAAVHLASWDGTSVVAVHNFADRPASADLQLPTQTVAGRWRPIFGPCDGQAAAIRDGRLTLDLPACGYCWFGRRRGV